MNATVAAGDADGERQDDDEDGEIQQRECSAIESRGTVDTDYFVHVRYLSGGPKAR